MKFSLLEASAALCMALAHTVLSEQRIGAGNFTLTRCPPGFGGENCFKDEKPAVVYPAKEDTAPGYRNGFYDFIVEWEATHLLTWEKEDDEPRNLTFSLGEYSLQRIIRSERAMNFTFKDLAIEMAPKSNSSFPERVVLAAAMRSSWNSIEFKVWNDAHNMTFGNGIKAFYALPANFFTMKF
ncbi:uncharacterized protein LMH87_009054 [Akanthomyces muscarius]|uniref:Uncharacterized protein n=1 Tax=Akanthomyces muscarius TaxID=2231603 RepID=A0A9W8QI29_AKAMU|nr:uncharacterized protein LMH87_009054 [Akanthomyces muscarius]KAJ4158532.1 hypothetical protein LMH87_009054 [Akanthomyces muscarius]